MSIDFGAVALHFQVRKIKKDKYIFGVKVRNYLHEGIRDIICMEFYLASDLIKIITIYSYFIE